MTEREAFEKYQWNVRKQFSETINAKLSNGDYMLPRLQADWELWRAAQAYEGRERQWISVLDQLPEMDSRFVLVFRPDYDCDSLETDVTTAQGQALWHTFRKFGKGVTHWMELPGKPAEHDTTPPQPAKTLTEAIKEGRASWQAKHGKCSMCAIGDKPDAAGYHRGVNLCGNLGEATPPQEVAADPICVCGHVKSKHGSTPFGSFCYGGCLIIKNAWEHVFKPAAAPEVAVPVEDYRADFDPDAIVATLRQKLAAAERENATLRERNEELQKALWKYGRHLYECDKWVTSYNGKYFDDSRECTCGYNAALAPSAERKPEVKG